MRHDGAHHLRSASLDLHWTQEALLDVYAASFFTLWMVVYFSYWLIKKLLQNQKGGQIPTDQIVYIIHSAKKEVFARTMQRKRKTNFIYLQYAIY